MRLSALLISVHGVRASDFAGSVAGVVTSASGEALSGAYVKLINPERHLTFMVVSQAQGRYNANNLPREPTRCRASEWLPEQARAGDVADGKAATADVSLTDKQGDMIANGWSPARPRRRQRARQRAAAAGPAGGRGQGHRRGEAQPVRFLHRLTQMRWTHDNWEHKVAWMRERIAERPGAVDLTEPEVKTVVDYLAKNFSDTTPKLDPNGRLSRTLLQGGAARYIAVDFAAPNHDAGLHDVAVDPRGIAWVNELNSYKLGRFDRETFEFTEVNPPPGPRKVGLLNHMGAPVRGVGDSIWVAEAGVNRRWLQYDTKYNEFYSFQAPAEFKGPMNGNSMRADPNGKMVWATANTRIVGLNVETKQFVAYDIPHWVENQAEPGRLRYRRRRRRQGVVRRARGEQDRTARPRHR